ncbi:hypothetical protein ATZ36_13885 [Candidatus Endomicrobiellum trichonymphae]|uniref:Uncharacterized protein n=1 Tax=Endomicrobium trichonymphae TaxID=1408204 RepID=A0A1E5IM83_ENDTX|nr:hypothetical protein ATZ36_13885 [Candidatus Endomicrobium trichonymphae]
MFFFSIAPPPPAKKKRKFSACIKFAFLLTSFTGWGKLKNVPLDLSQSEPLQQFNRPNLD